MAVFSRRAAVRADLTEPKQNLRSPQCRGAAVDCKEIDFRPVSATSARYERGMSAGRAEMGDTDGLSSSETFIEVTKFTVRRQRVRRQRGQAITGIRGDRQSPGRAIAGRADGV